jgi:hypothetical protein
MIDPEDVFRVCAEERIIPTLNREPVYFITEELFKHRMECASYGTDRIPEVTDDDVEKMVKQLIKKGQK